MKTAAIYSILLNNTSYADAIGSDPAGGVKVYPSESPQGTEKPYAIIVNPVSIQERQSKQGRGMVKVFFQIDHYAETTDQVENLDKLAISALDNYRGVVEGENINKIRVQGGSQGYEESQRSRRRTSEFSALVET